ncbi:MAG: 3'-5' exonuclease [Deltaproteobacteria bacterium]|nr:3'-5' exonuclease [Deltaproteobacteria bacterium]
MAGLADLLRGLPFFRKRPLHPLLAANREAFRMVDHDRPLAACRFTVLDTELTGLDAAKSEIVSIGAVHLEGLSIRADQTFSQLVKPLRALPKASTLIHRITPSQVQGAADLAEILPGFVEFLDDTLVVGHHVGLDMAFLNKACRKILGGKLANPCLDTLHMARIYRAEQWEHYYERYDLKVSYALSDLAAEYGLPRFPAHNALDDAMQTAYLFLYLVKKLKDGGIVTLRDLFEAGRSWRWYF